MDDVTFYQRIKELYHPPKNQFSLVDVPDIRYMAIDGKGDPQENGIDSAMQWLWSIVHFLLPVVKEIHGKRTAYPPIECLFWADDPNDFASGNKSKWQWRAMVVLENALTDEIFKQAVCQAEEKHGEKSPSSLRTIHLHEGQCVQYLHLGEYEEIPAICEKLYGEFLPEKGYNTNGSYHEIYLNDPSRTTPKKRKMIIRQAIK